MGKGVLESLSLCLSEIVLEGLPDVADSVQPLRLLLQSVAVKDPAVLFKGIANGLQSLDV